ncbi:HAMP domain-containing sensor histidine kinase [Breoghania sp. JC706]|uniref:sensor histidine kinase n=1 Tax=Breoghania sp. JC706 TaxID=3117732 RepID=UPI003009B056
MLDLKTLLLLELCLATLQAAAWFMIWRAWRHLYELIFIMGAFAMISIGLLLLFLRGPDPSAFRIVFDNAIIKVGVVLMAEGLARFLGQPRLLRIGLVLVVAQVVAWSAAVILFPDTLEIRIHISTLFTVTVMTMMCRTLIADRSQPRVLNWIGVVLLAEYMIASLLQSALAELYPATVENAPVLSNYNAWYFFQGTLFLMAFFVWMVFMVGARLSAELMDRNAALAREVEVRQRLEGELSDSLAAEKALRTEQRQLVRMVSHEFRTPLAIIRYATEMIGVLLARPTEAVAQRLSGIDEATSRMTTLIDRFLDTERQDDSVVEVTRVDFDALLGEVERHFDHIGCSDRLVFVVERPLPEYWGDADMLLSVLVNLVDNALKYSADDQAVETELEVIHGALRISVSDKGIGIPKSDLPHIGRRFFRASNTQAATGTGLGIHMCRRLLEYHDGTLTIGPRAPEGTIATVHLPLPGLSQGLEAGKAMTA